MLNFLQVTQRDLLERMTQIPLRSQVTKVLQVPANAFLMLSVSVTLL